MADEHRQSADSSRGRQSRVGSVLRRGAGGIAGRLWFAGTAADSSGTAGLAGGGVHEWRRGVSLVDPGSAAVVIQAIVQVDRDVVDVSAVVGDVAGAVGARPL